MPTRHYNHVVAYYNYRYEQAELRGNELLMCITADNETREAVSMVTEQEFLSLTSESSF